MDIWVEEIEGWTSRPFLGGYGALHELADSSFSGAVSVGDTWLFFVNGRVVAVGQYRQGAAGPTFEPGGIERFEDSEEQRSSGRSSGRSPREDATGTVYEAPHPSVPLLVAMQLSDGEVRGSYYTEQTPIEEVHETLSEGGFTGYLELSENVLSGDYYTVYQGGRSMDLGFVGNARRLKTDDDAKETARDEVGIYEVVAVDIDVTPIPEPDDEGAGAAGAAGAAAGRAGAGLDDGFDIASPPDSDAVSSDGADAETDADTEPGEGTAGIETDEPTPDEAATDEPVPATTAPDSESEEEPAADPSGTDRNDTGSETGPDTATSDDASAPDEPPTAAVERVESAEPADDTEPDREPDASASDDAMVGSAAASSASGGSHSTGASTSTDTNGGVSHTEQLASRSVPSVDPERTAEGSGAPSVAGSRRDRPGERRSQGVEDEPPTRAPEQTSTPEPSADDDVAKLRAELESVRESLTTAEADRDEARERIGELETELERVRGERDELRVERDELAAELEELREQASELEGQLGGGGTGPSLTEAEAFAGTNLFVRYESKGKTTVEDAHDGHGTPEDLAANLRVSAHTQFDSADATVAGRPFDQWLDGTQEYRFAEWLVSQFVFEIRDTGSAERMRDCYDALPGIDRIEFDGAVTVEDGEDETGIGFDIVCRDRMGEPLFVANLDDSRDPLGEAAMATLVQDAIEVCRTERNLAGAFYVTAAFYESSAMETARDATGSSLLSRDSRVSYVKESRKRGFHLSLVESRDGAFHLSVPDL